MLACSFSVGQKLRPKAQVNVGVKARTQTFSEPDPNVTKNPMPLSQASAVPKPSTFTPCKPWKPHLKPHTLSPNPEPEASQP